MTWYNFSQNNSGGRFDIDDEIGIGPQVWIEADDENRAVQKALSLGVYFNGVHDGMDCPCCGDRWHYPWDGHNKPSINYMFDFMWHNKVYLQHKNGTIERITKDTKHDYKQIRTDKDY